jgi:hypothetical protein
VKNDPITAMTPATDAIRVASIACDFREEDAAP